MKLGKGILKKLYLRGRFLNKIFFILRTKFKSINEISQLIDACFVDIYTKKQKLGIIDKKVESQPKNRRDETNEEAAQPVQKRSFE